MDLIQESYRNLFGQDKDKDLYADQVWELLQLSYKSIGGIKGKGFSNKQDMIKNIPFWKLNVVDGIVNLAIMYKDKSGRKLIALGTNGTQLGKDKLADALKEEFKRSYFEVSDGLLGYIVKTFGVKFVKDWAHKPIGDRGEIEQEYLTKFPELADYFYARKLDDGEMHTKISLGTRNKPLTFLEWLHQ